MLGAIGRKHFEEEIVGLRGHHADEGNLAELFLEIFARLDKLAASLRVVLAVFGINLHEELGKGIDIPDAHHLLQSRHKARVGATKDAEAQAWDAVTFGDGLNDAEVGIAFEESVGKEGILGKANAKIHETLVQHKADTTLFAPSGQPMHPLHGNKVARWIVGVDEQKGVHGMLGEIGNQIVGIVAKHRVLRHEGDHPFGSKAVGIFLERGANDTDIAFEGVHQCLDEFGGPVAWQDIFGTYVPTLAGQPTINGHACGIFGNEYAEVGLHLIDNL